MGLIAGIVPLLTSGWPILLLGAAGQLLILGLRFKVRPWALVVMRTLIVQICAVVAARVLGQEWPFSFSAVVGTVPLPLVFVEGAVLVWYLAWPRR